MIMCAIAGILGSTGENREVLESMLKTMTRRGPDQWGIFQGKGLSLLHARLAVVDLEGGRQPMELLHKGVHYHMVYNGELYNTEELRRLLVLEGHTFLGHSDTEVVLHAYAQWGDGCVERFNGIFAFAVWEEEPERLFLARDRIGVKPLFYTVRGGQLLFASELKTLLAHPSVPAQVDAQGVAEVMLLGPGRTPGCGVFRGIREVEPGCCGYFDGQDMRLRRYWRLEDREHIDSLPQTLERVRALVTDAIRRAAGLRCAHLHLPLWRAGFQPHFLCSRPGGGPAGPEAPHLLRRLQGQRQILPRRKIPTQQRPGVHPNHDPVSGFPTPLGHPGHPGTGPTPSTRR